MKESSLRTIEAFVAIAASYMASVTMVHTTLYLKIIGKFINYFGPEFEKYVPYINLGIIVLVMFIAFNYWKKGDEIGFGRLFNLNMLMFFPAVLDFSTFNWVGLIFNLTPIGEISDSWVFGVGLLLQITYLMLRYTVRFRYGRTELLNRGAEIDDVDKVSWGQMYYLAALVAGTSVICFILFQIYPYLDSLLDVAKGLPIPHITIGIAISLVVAGATVLYLRSSGEDIEE